MCFFYSLGYNLEARRMKGRIRCIHIPKDNVVLIKNGFDDIILSSN